MNQREYSWESKEIRKFLDDIFHIYEENKYLLKMGGIINLNYNNSNDIYDGQQRILTIILIMIVISCLSENKKLKIKIIELLAVDTELDDLTPRQTKLKDEYSFNIIPKIYCINPYDMKGLLNIFNDKIVVWGKYIDNLHDIESFLEDEDYVCNICKTKTSRKSDFIRHLKSHDYSPPDSSTKLYAAFIDIYNYFILKKYDEKDLISLQKFILDDIDIQYYDCNDPEYVSRIFDWENNRGTHVETLDIIKNPILVQIQDDLKIYVYNEWEDLKRKTNKIYKQNFGQRIFDIAIQIYNNKIQRQINLEELFRPIITSKDTYSEITKLFNIIKRLFEIMDNISNDRFGRLINNTSRICLNWEAYMWCLLPIFYKTDNINIKLINLMTKWYFRNLQFKTRNFNNLCYSNEFIKITNEVLKNPGHDYFKDINDCLLKNKDVSINKENYLREMASMNFKSTNATHLLLYLETCINTDSHTVSLDLTLEHIVCQKDKIKLSDQSLMNNIGNLTLIEGKNSTNGHKGNSSLGSKPYDMKILSYRGSSSNITRNVAETYTETFTEETIVNRNHQIIELLNTYTDY
jgi:hypothetical protein